MRNPPPTPPEGALQAGKARLALAGFFLAGLFMSFLGPILPAWGYHLKSDFSTVGLYFLAMAVGITASVAASQRLAPRYGVSRSLVVGSAIECAALFYLSAVGPPMAMWWRIAGVFLVGGGSGLLIGGLFHAIGPIYRHDRAATVNIAGTLFVLGSLTMALLVAGTFYVYRVGSILFLLAFIPGLFAGKFAGTSFDAGVSREQPDWRQALQDSRSPVAVLFALLLFFQFGNEWSIAGWLTIFLIQRIGVSPESSLLLLALYWAAILFGRLFAQFLLSRVVHTRLLLLSVAAALFGCLVLSLTKSAFGATVGILFVGGGFATIYPLVVEKIGDQFPYFHPTLFNGIFSFAMVGGLLAPWTLGLLADEWGIGVLMVLPLAGTALVFFLLIMIWTITRLSGRGVAT